MTPTPRFDAAVARVLDGDESIRAAYELEVALRDDYPADARVDELRAALEGYSPEGTGLYCPAEVLRQTIRAALAELGRLQARSAVFGRALIRSGVDWSHSAR